MAELKLDELRQFGSLEFIARQVVEGFITGLHKSPFHGFSVEFAEHRIYNNGESTRHIDWKLFGRTDKLFVKRYEEETNLRCQLVIDGSTSMYFPLPEKGQKKMPDNKITFSVYAAAAITQLLKRQRDAVGLSVFAGDVNFHAQAKSSAVHHSMLYAEMEGLLQTPPEGEPKLTSAAAALHEIAENIHKRSLVVIFSDMLDSANADEVFNALLHLKHNKHEVILFHVTDKRRELEFEFENRPYKFIDMETGEQMRVLPAEVKAQYTGRMAEFKGELKLRCGQYKIDYVEADINEGFRQVLMPYLLKRGKMF